MLSLQVFNVYVAHEKIAWKTGHVSQCDMTVCETKIATRGGIYKYRIAGLVDAT